MSLFGDLIEEDNSVVEFPDVPELETSEKLAREKDVLGVYVSGHPFEKFASAFTDCNFSCLKMQNYEEDEDGNRTYPDLTDGEHVAMGGIIGAHKRINTRSGSPMAFITVEDLYGGIECVAFPSVYERIRDVLADDKIVRIEGKMQVSSEKAPVIILDKMTEFDPEAGAAAPAPSGGGRAVAPKRERAHALWLNASALTEEDFEEFTSLFAHYMNGDTVVKIKRGDKLYRMTNINDCHGLRGELGLFLDEADIIRT